MFSVLSTHRAAGDILRFVWNDEHTVGEICGATPEITFGAVSQHLKILLEEAGLVTKRQEGLHRYYKARREELGPLQSWLESMWNSALYKLRIIAELEQARRGPKPQKKRRKK